MPDPSADRAPRVWCLLGHRTGDDNQILALAEALGWPFEIRRLRYTPARLLPNGLSPGGLVALDGPSRASMMPSDHGTSWPALTIGSGRRSVHAARWVRRRSGGATRSVQIGWPRAEPGLLDLTVTTANYPVPPGPDVLRLPVAMSRPRFLSEEDERRLAAMRRRYPEPWTVLLVGGPSWPWRLGAAEIARAANHLAALAEAKGGSLLVSTSRRTPDAVTAALRSVLTERGRADALFGPNDPGGNPYPALLAGAGRFAVTADSAAMLSEAIATGRPVSMVPIRKGVVGSPPLPGRAGRGRDLPAFWDELCRRELVGTIDAPLNEGTPDAARVAGAWVAERMGRPLGPDQAIPSITSP